MTFGEGVPLYLIGGHYLGVTGVRFPGELAVQIAIMVWNHFWVFLVLSCMIVDKWSFLTEPI